MSDIGGAYVLIDDAINDTTHKIIFLIRYMSWKFMEDGVEEFLLIMILIMCQTGEI